MKPILVKYVALATVLALVSAAGGQEKVSVRTNLFMDNSGTAVQSPALEFAKKLTNDIVFSMRYTLDRVIIPPIRGLAATPSPTDAITGASRPVSGDEPANQAFTKERNEVTLGVELPFVGLGYYYSNEADYLGRMATISTDFDFNQMNTNLALRYSYGWDRITPLGTDTLHTKNTHSVNATLTQILSPVMIGRAGVDIAHVDGFQSNPYRSVFAGGLNRPEVHPQERLRAAIFFKVNRYFTTRTAVNAEYRFYRDSWNVQSHTLGVLYYQYFSDNLLIRYRYRYYVQSAAHFYRRQYGSVQPYITSDYKLEPFNAHLFGLKVEYKLKNLVEGGVLSFLANGTLEAKYERYFSSNDFIADIYQIALVVNY